MCSTFEIPGRLMGLNEYTNLCRRHHFAGARAKREQTEIVEACIMAAKVRRFTCPVDIGITWIEGGRLRDHDNIRFGAKFIIDALVSCGVIKDDSPRYLHHIYDHYKHSEKNPRIQVVVMPAKPEGRTVFYAGVSGVKGQTWN